MLTAEDEFKLGAVWDILQTRLIRRNVPVKNMDLGEIEPASGSTVHQVVKLKQGIPTEAGKAIVKFLKDQGLKKVQAHRGRPGPRHVGVEGRPPGGHPRAQGARLRPGAAVW